MNPPRPVHQAVIYAFKQELVSLDDVEL